jgi:hypothetical protein
MQQFYKQHMPEQITWSCGEPVQTVEHILLDCPNYTATRLKHLTANGCPWNLPWHFDHLKRVTALLRFLEEMGAGVRPRMEWEPGWEKHHAHAYERAGRFIARPPWPPPPLHPIITLVGHTRPNYIPHMPKHNTLHRCPPLYSYCTRCRIKIQI